MAGTDWKEKVAEDEGKRFEGYGEALRELQRKRAKGGKAARALHAKGQVGVEGELVVLGDLPEEARVGLFAKPGVWRAYVRVSNGAGARQSDRKGDVRGIGIKVVGVEGKKIIPGMEGAKTQDFLAIQTAATPFRDPDEFVYVVRGAESPALLPFRMIGRFGFRGITILKRLVGGISQPVSSVATSRYWSALPIKYGERAAKYSLVPHERAAEGAKQGDGENYLGEELAGRLAAGEVSWDFKVQFFVSEEKTPIEDASVEWKEEDAPFVTVARLTLKKQDCASERGKKVAERIEGMSFDPWHSLEEFRPLGSMMRARNVAYRLSTQERGAASEPDGTEWGT